jgi:hypothetical protein
MKKIVIAGMLASVFGVASAVEVSVGGVYDSKAEKSGVRVTASAGKIGSFTPIASYTHIDGVYNRYAVGGAYSIVGIGPVNLSATASGVYQDTPAGINGYGVTAGLKAQYDVTKNIAVIGTVERFVGQDRVSDYNATVAGASVAFKF